VVYRSGDHLFRGTLEHGEREPITGVWGSVHCQGVMERNPCSWKTKLAYFASFCEF